MVCGQLIRLELYAGGCKVAGEPLDIDGIVRNVYKNDPDKVVLDFEEM